MKTFTFTGSSAEAGEIRETAMSATAAAATLVSVRYDIRTILVWGLHG
jgi:hypothetical protein